MARRALLLCTTDVRTRAGRIRLATMTTHDPSPDALQAPWRMPYLESVDDAKPPYASAGTGSFLLDYWRESAADERNHVIARTQNGLILLNAFPYAAGHLLVALGDARPTLLDYDSAQRRSLWELADVAMAIMLRALRPQGVNVGFNQGRAAGAGVPQHLHLHLVPRWGGDVNFMSTIGHIRVLPASLDRMAERYRAAWVEMNGVEGWLRTQGVQL